MQYVYPRYESYDDGFIVDHAHNDYLELLSDTGIAGGVCGLAFLVLLFTQGFANLRAAQSPVRSAFYCGALAARAGILLHSLVDFNLHIPSNALLFVLTASCQAPASTGNRMAGITPLRGSRLLNSFVKKTKIAQWSARSRSRMETHPPVKVAFKKDADDCEDTAGARRG